MDAIQQAEAKEILADMIQTSAMMSAVMDGDEVPGEMIGLTGKVFTTSLAELASLIGGDEWRNEILYQSMDSIEAMSKFMEIVDGFND